MFASFSHLFVDEETNNVKKLLRETKTERKKNPIPLKGREQNKNRWCVQCFAERKKTVILLFCNLFLFFFLTLCFVVC